MRHLAQLILTSLFFFSAVSLQAQKDDDDSDGFNGLRAGYYSSGFEGDFSVSDPRAGFYAGYYRNLIKIPLYRLSSGLEYHTSGGSNTVANITNEVRLSYLSLVINNRIKIGPIYGDVGLAPGLRLSEKSLLNGAEVDIPDDAKAESFDLMVHAGLGFKVLFVGIEARYRLGLLDVYDGTQNAGFEIGLCTFF